MKKALIIVFVILTNLSNAQEFAPIGAKWHIITRHGALTNDNPSFRSNLIECIDTVWIDSIRWSKIQDSSPALLGSTSLGVIPSTFYYVREDSTGKIFFKHPVTGFTFMLFDKNAEIGNIWSYPIDTCWTASSYYYNGGCQQINNYCRFQVDEIDTVVLNNKPAKRIKLNFSQSINQPYEPNKTTFLYEPFGFQLFTFLLRSYCSADLDEKLGVGLRCYEDDYWGLISFTDSVACDSSWLIPTSINKINDIGFELFPNPASNLLNIQIKENQGNVFQMDIVDLQGRKVLSKQIINSMNVQVSISNLKSGMYFINIEQGRRSTTKKFTVLN